MFNKQLIEVLSDPKLLMKKKTLISTCIRNCWTGCSWIDYINMLVQCEFLNYYYHTLL